MHLLQQALTDADPAAIEETFKQSPELSYKLMRLVNSVSMGLKSKIQSLSHALVVLGTQAAAALAAGPAVRPPQHWRLPEPAADHGGDPRAS